MERNTKQRVAISVALTLIVSFIGALPVRADSIEFGDVTQGISGGQVSLRAVQSGASRPSSSLTATDSIQTPSSASGVETIQLGDVSGTICNCGEMRSPGGFPFLALLPLAAIPFFFIGHHRNTPPPDVFPTPTPTPPTPVPEPTTLLLLGSGLFALGAGARRRRAHREQLNG